MGGSRHQAGRVAAVATVATLILSGAAVPAATASVPPTVRIGVTAGAGHPASRGAGSTPSLGGGSAASVAAGYAFLDEMMDRYATGETTRLVQSFTGGVLQRRGFTDAEVYDNALVIDALLARGTTDDVDRAEVIGDALLFVQAQDPAADGRIRAAYAPDPLLAPSDVHVTDTTSDVGVMAWAGTALVQLALRTGHAAYLQGAVALGDWIQTHAVDSRGAGGYTGGLNAKGTPVRWKSTEHNIDVAAFFTMLAGATGDATWNTRVEAAQTFVNSMWDPSAQMFHVGTLDDGVTTNTAEQPEDVNSWSYLARPDPATAGSITWDVDNLSVTRHGFSGVSFCTGDRSGVWFEGTAHLADALRLRNGPGDAALAQQFLDDIATAQADAPHADGQGIDAASKNGLRDCDGDRYFASLHTGATSWYLLASQSVDPFVAIPAAPVAPPLTGRGRGRSSHDRVRR
jgi:hypothetical protein